MIYKSCNKCRALEGIPKNWACSLNYAIDTTNRRPLAPCPKPRNIRTLIKEQKQKNKRAIK